MLLPDSVYDRIEHSVDVLLDSPGLLRDYDPPYDAALPPIDCKWYFVPGTCKVLYLTVDHKAQHLKFLFIGDTRQDPMRRFDDME